MCDPEAGSEDEREGDNRRARPMLAGWRLRHGWGVREEATEHTGTGTLGDVPAAGLLKWWQQQQRRGGKEVGTVATAVRVEAGSSREGERTEAAGGPQRAGGAGARCAAESNATERTLYSRGRAKSLPWTRTR